MVETSKGQLPTKKVGFEVDVSKETPHIDFRELGTFEGEKIEFPDVKYFGFEHGSNTQRMAWVLMSYADVDEDGVKLPDEKCVIDTAYNRRVMWMAAFFHDIGRTQEWFEVDRGANARSIVLTRCVFEQYPELKEEAGGKFMTDVLELMFNYKFGKDALSKCLREAERFEEARFAPNTKKALARLEIAWGGMETFFGAAKGHQQQYQRSKGWAV